MNRVNAPTAPVSLKINWNLSLMIFICESRTLSLLLKFGSYVALSSRSLIVLFLVADVDILSNVLTAYVGIISKTDVRKCEFDKAIKI